MYENQNDLLMKVTCINIIQQTKIISHQNHFTHFRKTVFQLVSGFNLPAIFPSQIRFSAMQH